MNQKTYNYLTATLFLIIGVLHIFRIANGWEAVIAETEIPIFASWIAVVISLVLAYIGFSKGKQE